MFWKKEKKQTVTNTHNEFFKRITHYPDFAQRLLALSDELENEARKVYDEILPLVTSIIKGEYDEYSITRLQYYTQKLEQLYLLMEQIFAQSEGGFAEYKKIIPMILTEIAQLINQIAHKTKGSSNDNPNQ